MRPVDPAAITSSVLVVANSRIRSGLESTISPIVAVRAVASIAKARELLREGPAFDAWFVSEELPDGAGLDFVRAESTRPPVVLVAEARRRPSSNAAFALGAWSVVWPIETVDVEAFLRRLDDAARDDAERRLAAHTRAVRTAGKFTDSEATVYGQMVVGGCAKEIAVVGGVKVSTVRRHLEAIRRKLKSNSIDDLRWSAIRRILPLKRR